MSSLRAVTRTVTSTSCLMGSSPSTCLIAHSFQLTISTQMLTFP